MDVIDNVKMYSRMNNKRILKPVNGLILLVCLENLHYSVRCITIPLLKFKPNFCVFLVLN